MLGECETHIENAGQIINGIPVDFVWFELTNSKWVSLFEKWDRLLK